MLPTLNCKWSSALTPHPRASFRTIETVLNCPHCPQLNILSPKRAFLGPLHLPQVPSWGRLYSISDSTLRLTQPELGRVMMCLPAKEGKPVTAQGKGAGSLGAESALPPPDLSQPLLGQEQDKNSQEEGGAWRSESSRFSDPRFPYTESEQVRLLRCFACFTQLKPYSNKVLWKSPPWRSWTCSSLG